MIGWEEEMRRERGTVSQITHMIFAALHLLEGCGQRSRIGNPNYYEQLRTEGKEKTATAKEVMARSDAKTLIVVKRSEMI